MAGISNAVLSQSIKDILKGADLSSLSSKKVRRKLEEKFGADLTDRKKEIDKILMQLISGEDDEQSDTGSEDGQEEDRGSSGDDNNGDDDDDDGGGHKRPSKQKSTSNGLSDQSEEEGHSDESQSDDSRPASPPPKKSKSQSSKSKKEKRAKSHHTDKMSDSELDDEQLAKKLQEEENNFRSRPRSVKRAPPPPKKERKPKEGKARVSIYSKPCLLSGELATVMGTDKMARKDVVKRMWEIVRERKLEDPKNKQYMLCDEQLQRVFGRKRVRTFGMMKHLKSHIKDAVD